MKLALTSMIPSPELYLLAEALKVLGEVQEIPSWSPETHTVQYDVAVCVGPVKVCPLAKRKVLFVLGQTKNHSQLGWDAVVVTSEKARKLARQRFGMETRIRVIPPYLSGLHIARRRLVEPKRQLLHVSEGGIPLGGDIGVLTIWDDLGFDLQGDQRGYPPEMFSLLEFNSRIKAGAIGLYPECMEDGYDVQVRRHLALGGAVVCRRDQDVLGDLVDLCVNKYEENMSEKVEPVNCAGDEDEYKERVVGFVAKV